MKHHRRIYLIILFLAQMFHASWSHAEIIEKEFTNDFLRLKIASLKNEISINTKEDDKILVTFANKDLLPQVVSAFSLDGNTQQYISGVTIDNDQLVLLLKDDSIELFPFYKEDQKKYILDFWINKDKQKVQTVVEAKEVNPQKAPPIPKKIAPPPKVVIKEPVQVDEEPEPVIVEKKNPYLDFRYGASFVWQYNPLVPKLNQPIQIQNKTPEFFFPIEDRVYKEDEQESHLQLIINFYRKEKFGYMAKAIKVFESKYPNHKYQELMTYIKANALIKQNIQKPRNQLMNSGLTLLEELAEKTDEYDFKRALYQYLLYVHLHQGNIIKSLENAQKLYVVANTNYDEELIYFSSKVILDSLAKLKQLNKIRKFLEEPIVKKFLKDQSGIAYQIYILSLDQKYDEVIALYEEKKKSLEEPIEPSILFNVAESYYQVAEYTMASKLFDRFLVDFSELSYASYARNRLALSYDILDESPEKIDTLYRKAVDFGGGAKARYEAKLRYFGYKYLRNKERISLDPSMIALLNYTEEERKQLDVNLKKLLWLCRLRSFIVEKNFTKAIAYYKSIPLNELTYFDREVFEKDFYESVFGRIKENYDKGKYAEVVKLWEHYKEINLKYQKKDASVSYYVGIAYLGLGFTKEFIELLEVFKTRKKSYVKEYPLWVERDTLEITYENIMMKKLAIEKNWEELENFYKSNVKDKNNIYLKEKYVRSLFNQKKYSEYINESETILLQGEYKNLSSEDFETFIFHYVLSLKEKSTKFVLKTEAILKDPYIKQFSQLSDRINYILFEEYAKNKVVNYQKIEKLWVEYKSKFSGSDYYSRVKYIYATSLTEVQQIEKGKTVLREIASDEKTPSYLKKLSQAELKALEEKEKI
ncbi:MAG: hypothetical protein H6621_12760 [Halobacteriovoraceae bacterium]|nr:hypothetical protein [Halobacteriovoraceae bacterium]MCB9095932.1 hypothetical protein [Halobacteriovoraceae bacterium]